MILLLSAVKASVFVALMVKGFNKGFALSEATKKFMNEGMDPEEAFRKAKGAV